MVRTAIAIIDATENTGSAVARALAAGPYRLLLFSHDAVLLTALEKEIRKAAPTADIDCMGCPAEASWEADVILLTVPQEAEEKMAETIREVATQKVVASLGQPKKSNHKELQALLPSSKIVKVFVNPTNAARAANDQAAEMLIAGTDNEAVQVVRELMQRAGFRTNIIDHSTISKPVRESLITNSN